MNKAINKYLTVLSLLLFSCLSHAESFIVTYEGAITHAQTGDAAAYGLGVGDFVTASILIDTERDGYYVEPDGTINFIHGFYWSSRNYSDSFYAEYISGSFLTDPSVIGPTTRSWYYAYEDRVTSRYDSWFEAEITVLNRENILSITRRDDSYTAIMPCLYCPGESFRIRQSIDGLDDVFGDVTVTSVTNAVPLLPAHIFLITGIVFFGWLGKRKKTI